MPNARPMPDGSAFDVLVIGAGAAGMMCAAVAGQRGRRVLLIEHMEEPGKKILISGGGRCNFTNLEVKPERFISANPHFARSALARYTQADFIALVQRYGIPFYEKTLGQLFCDGAGSARKIVDMLRAECAQGEVTWAFNTSVEAVRHDTGFEVTTSAGICRAERLVVACGGLSIPKIGATDLAFRIAEQFDVPVIAPRPGLVPLTFGEDELAHMTPFSGASLDAVARCGQARFREAMLFTHRGLSGPSILQISSYWHEGEAIRLNLLPDVIAEDWLKAQKRQRPRAELQTVLGEVLPQRFAADCVARRAPWSLHRPLADVKDRDLQAFSQDLQDWPVHPSGTEGYAKAEVTLGGVDTRALSSKTMQVTAVPGLFFIGEAVDVTGWLGGYNFQWAWSSGWAAGQAV